MKYKAVELGSRNIGDPSGNRSVDVYWSSKYEYWYATIDPHPTQYKNIFGLEMPTERDATMIGMINFSKKGWKAQGLIIENKDTNKIAVAHKGGLQCNIGGKSENRIRENISYNNSKEDECSFIECSYIDNKNNEKKATLICEFPEPLDDESQYTNFQSKVKDFITKVNEIKKRAKNKKPDGNHEKQAKKKTSINNSIDGNKPNTLLIKKNKISESNKLKQQSISNDEIKQKNESSYEIAKRVREIILSINENCKLQKKKGIFDEAALFRLWGNIEKTCGSKNDFKGFAENLYKLLRETTREINPNKRNKNDPHYLFRIPNNFIKNDPTKHFWDIVNTLRHYFVHDEIGDIANVYKEFLGSSSGSESSDDYSKLQIKIVNLFEESMKILLEIINNL